MFTIVYRPDFFLSTPIPCYIFIKQMSLFVVGGGGVSTYNFMLYVNVRRLNNSVLTYFMRTHAFFLFCRQCYRTFPCFSWSLVDVLIRIALTGNYKKNSSHTFPFRYFIYNFLQKFNYFFFKLLNFNRLILISLDSFLFLFF